MIRLNTPRLLLREFELSDAPDLFALNADEEVIQYTGDSAFASISEAEDLIKNYDQYAKYNCGRLTMILKQTNEFVGWCGLKYDPESGETDIGFRLMKKYWNKGLATEAAQACLDYGFRKLKLKKIIARVLKSNSGSISVLKKAGMAYHDDMDFHGQPGEVYEMMCDV